MKTTRRVVQLAFLGLTLAGVFLVKGNAERWCPFGGVEALYSYADEGNLICSLGVSNFYILAAVLVITLLLRRAFCGYLCPVGTISEWLQSGAKRIGVRPIRVPYRLDRGLALLKYVVLGVILFVTWRAAELHFRGYDPCYALISRHGEDITAWAYVISGAVVVASLIILVPFCRWFCPLAAVLHPFSRFGLTRIRRHESACTDCGVCAEVCPMGIPVDKVRQVTAARCLSCLNCVEACPNADGGAVTWGPPKALGRRWPLTPRSGLRPGVASRPAPRRGARGVKGWPQTVLVAILLAGVATAVAATYAFPLPSFVKTRGQRPAETAVVRLEIYNLTCRGNATLLTYFLERDDEFALSGYLKLEAWSEPEAAPVRITYDPTRTDETAIKEAITEPYFDAVQNIWRTPPFRIVGYDPLGLNEAFEPGVDRP
jgi:ferredoxin